MISACPAGRFGDRARHPVDSGRRFVLAGPMDAEGAGSKAEQLRRMGDAQELRRRMGRLSNFTVAFSSTRILAGGITSLPLGSSAAQNVPGARPRWVVPAGLFGWVMVASFVLARADVAPAARQAGFAWLMRPVLPGPVGRGAWVALLGANDLCGPPR